MLADWHADSQFACKCLEFFFKQQQSSELERSFKVISILFFYLIPVNVKAREEVTYYLNVLACELVLDLVWPGAFCATPAPSSTPSHISTTTDSKTIMFLVFYGELKRSDVYYI